MTDTLRLVSVEDQQVDAELVADALAAAGLAVKLERVDDEAGFLQAIETAWPDAILCDWNLPRFSGRRALEIARDRCPEVPCIVVSGTIRDATVIEALRQGAADCIHKNQLELLAPALERALEHARRQRVMREQENQLQLFRALIDHSSDGVFIVDPATGGLLDVNETACRDLRYTRDELLQRGVMDIQTVLRDAAAWQAHVRELRAQGRALLEFAALRKDGSRFPVEVSLRHTTVANQPYIIAIVRDITERKEAESRIAEQMEELRRWNEVTLGREMRSIELKHEVNELLAQAGQPPRYPSAEQDETTSPDIS